MIALCAGSAGLTQMAGSSAASPPLGTGSVSTVAETVSSAAAVEAADFTTCSCAPALSSPDFDFSMSFFFSDLAPGAPESTVCAETARKVSVKVRTATTSVNTKLLIDFNPRLEFISYVVPPKIFQPARRQVLKLRSNRTMSKRVYKPVSQMKSG